MPSRARRWSNLGVAFGIAAVLLRSASAAAQSSFDAVFDLRLLGSDARTVWLDQGLDKQRFGHDDPRMPVVRHH